MKNLNEILKETDFTVEEENIFKKVLRHYQAEDLQTRLYEKLECESITQEKYDEAVENAEEILERYDKTNNDEWFADMDSAINYILGK